MKTRFVFFMLLFVMLGSIASLASQRVNYTYDAAGNRISRTIVMSKQLVKPELNEESKPLLDELNKKRITIYPNPTRGYLAVDIAGMEDDTNVSLQIYDMQGKLILSRNASTSRTELDLSSQSSGTYILKIVVDDESTNWKIIKD